MDDQLRDTTVLQLARWHFHLTDLETRNRDHLDFHEVSVETIRRALTAAYEAGYAASDRKQSTARTDSPRSP